MFAIQIEACKDKVYLFIKYDYYHPLYWSFQFDLHRLIRDSEPWDTLYMMQSEHCTFLKDVEWDMGYCITSKCSVLTLAVEGFILNMTDGMPSFKRRFLLCVPLLLACEGSGLSSPFSRPWGPPKEAQYRQAQSIFSTRVPAVHSHVSLSFEWGSERGWEWDM